MSVKKLLVLAAGLAVMGTTAVMAGGPDHMAMPAQPAFQNSIYLDGHLGYDQSDWVNTGRFSTITKNGKGGFTGGLDLGYNFTHNIALEAGWFYLPTVTGTISVAGDTVKSWVLYAAAKMSAAVMDNLDIFAKAGVGYRSVKATSNNVTTKGQYWLPLFAAGLEYTYGSWLFGAQYTLITGNDDNSNTADEAQTAHLYTGFVGYKFNV